MRTLGVAALVNAKSAGGETITSYAYDYTNNGVHGGFGQIEQITHDGKASPCLDEASLRRVSRLGGDGRYDTFAYDAHERLTTEHYNTSQDATLFRYDYEYDDDGNRYRKEYRDDDDLRVYYSDAGGETSDGEDTNLAPSNRVVRAWTKTDTGEKLMGNKVNVTGSYTETNLWSISVEANDSGSPVDATFRDGFWIARGVSLDDNDDNRLEATITDLGDNSSTYPVSPSTYPLKLDRNLNVAYEYDAAGNITKKTQVVDYDEGGGGTYITRYFYDDAKRLAYIDYNWTTIEDVHYVYDPIGQRIEIEYGEIELDGEDFDDFTAASARGFVCWGGNVLEEWTVSSGSLNTLVYRYVRNPATNLGGGIGSIAYQVDGSDYRYYHYNHKGDTGALTDEDGKIVAWYEYEAWGNVVTEWEASGVENEFRFSTKQWDATPAGPPDQGLIYFGARYLDPELGRWTQMDPAGTVNGLNAYSYVEDEPVEGIDAWGLRRSKTFNDSARGHLYWGSGFIYGDRINTAGGVSIGVRSRNAYPYSPGNDPHMYRGTCLLKCLGFSLDKHRQGIYWAELPQGIEGYTIMTRGPFNVRRGAAFIDKKFRKGYQSDDADLEEFLVTLHHEVQGHLSDWKDHDPGPYFDSNFIADYNTAVRDAMDDAESEAPGKTCCTTRPNRGVKIKSKWEECACDCHVVIAGGR